MTLGAQSEQAGAGDVYEPLRSAVADICRPTTSWEGSRFAPGFLLSVAALSGLLFRLRERIREAEAQSSVELADQQSYEALTSIVFPRLHQQVQAFESVTRQIAPEQVASHRWFAQHCLHPYVLESPLIKRAFVKPLGYPGDYGVVNMMLREQHPLRSSFGRIVDDFHLQLGPVQAHRNRIDTLVARLKKKLALARARRTGLDVMNVGCGPAVELQRLVRDSDLSNAGRFTLLDFNRETIDYAKEQLETLKLERRRETHLDFRCSSVTDLVRQASRRSAQNTFDVIYCAGLFDYLTDRTCARLIQVFYQMLRKGGLLLITNVHPANPVAGYMALVVEWELRHRDEQHMQALAAGLGQPRTFLDATGLNVFLEIRKPE